MILSPYIRPLVPRKQICFLDVVSIHQTDQDDDIDCQAVAKAFDRRIAFGSDSI